MIEVYTHLLASMQLLYDGCCAKSSARHSGRHIVHIVPKIERSDLIRFFQNRIDPMDDPIIVLTLYIMRCNV